MPGTVTVCTTGAVSRRRSVAALCLLLLGGCSLLRPTPPPPPVVVPLPPPEVPRAADPLATHEFVFDPARDDVVGRVQLTEVGPDDTLPEIARRFNLGYEEIVRANPGVDPWLPGAGRTIVLPTEFVLPDAPRTGLIVNIAAMRVFYFPKREPGKPATVITHPIGIGKVGWSTPEGTTTILARVKDPVWTPPESVRKEHLKDGDELPAKVPAGPDNPLGAYLFRLGWPSYLIHGTNKPYGVGMRSSHGCIRLYPEDIARFFDSVPVGTQVRVVNQPYVLGWQHERLLVQAYGPLSDDKRDWDHGPSELLKRAKGSHSPLWQKVRAHVADVDWEAARALGHSTRGIPVSVTKGAVQSEDSVIATALKVRNELPAGATWDGDVPARGDQEQYRELMGAREPAAGRTGTR